MKKIKLKKEYLIAIGVVLLLVIAGLGYWYARDRFDKSEDANSVTEEDVATPTEEEISPEVEDTNGGDIPEETETIEYVVSGLNKKDGDILAIPDDITFSISPKVEQTKITVKDATGKVLYTTTKAFSSGTATVYPSGKPAEGASGTITVEGYVGNAVVTSKVVRIVF
jgi:hypothetical protein